MCCIPLELFVFNYFQVLSKALLCFVVDTGLQSGGGLGFSPGTRKLGGSDQDEFNSALGLGELAGLTVTNEADPSNYDVSGLFLFSGYIAFLYMGVWVSCFVHRGFILLWHPCHFHKMF